MGMALYHLHWSPTVFWAATPHELYAAIAAGNRENPEEASREEFRKFREEVSEAGR